MSLNTIEEALIDLKNGKMIIVVDDENRENEGDFILPAETVTPEIINFMAIHGRGLICVPLTSKRCKQLGLNHMVDKNTELMETAFTVSVDLKGNGVTSGISASDRAKTILSLVNNVTKPEDLARPGHIFPLVAKDGGVLRRTGHTEAAIDLARLAGFKPAGVVCEIMNEDGTMARLPELKKVAEKFNLKIISIEDLVSYRMKHDTLIDQIDCFKFNSIHGEFDMHVFKQNNNDQIHLALKKGKWNDNEAVLTRITSLGSINNLIESMVNEGYQGYDSILKIINNYEKGVVVFINQESEANNIINWLNTIKDKHNTGDKALPYKKMDAKDFGVGAQILHKLNIKKINLLTNSKTTKRVGLSGYGLEITDQTSF